MTFSPFHSFHPRPCPPAHSSRSAHSPLPVCLSQTVATPARAQAPAPAAPSAAPDVVLLKNGGMLRGLIVELVPDQSISLLLPTGETRTIPMDDVSFAGPSEAVPWKRPPEAAPPVPSAPEEKKPEGEGIEPFITLHGERARLRLIGKEPNLTVHVKSGTATTTGRTSSTAPTPTRRSARRLVRPRCRQERTSWGSVSRGRV